MGICSCRRFSTRNLTILLVAAVLVLIYLLQQKTRSQDAKPIYYQKIPLTDDRTREEDFGRHPYVQLQGSSNNQTNGLPPCGSVCNYGGEYSQRKWYPFISKSVDCHSIMKRMAWSGYKPIIPPPKRPPTFLIKDYTLHGECPFGRDFYKDDLHLAKISVEGFPQKKITNMIEKDKRGERINLYDDGRHVSRTIAKYKEFVTGKRGFVVGTVKPWMEALFLGNGASHVTTIEYRLFPLEHPNMTLITPYTFGDLYTAGETTQFDFGGSYSSLEHAGLGRYGDPLNPFGDMEAMAQAYCITKPGGVYFLGVPYSKNCHIEWNAHRMYSFVRLKHMTANWEVLNISYDSNYHIFLVLQKPYK